MIEIIELPKSTFEFKCTTCEGKINTRSDFGQNMIVNIITDFKIALEKAQKAEPDYTLAYAILKSSIIAKISDLELLAKERETTLSLNKK